MGLWYSGGGNPPVLVADSRHFYTAQQCSGIGYSETEAGHPVAKGSAGNSEQLGCLEDIAVALVQGG